MLTELLIIGAGGHSKVVIEAASGRNLSYHIKVADQDKLMQGEKILQKFPIRYLDDWSIMPDNFHVAIGSNEVRKQLSMVGVSHNKIFSSVIHEDAHVSSSCTIGNGTFIAAGAIVAAESKIEEGCIVNHAAVIDHDCCIGAYSHIAPNVTMGGGVHIGEGCLIGAAAVILPQIRIGHHVTIGAGAVVTKDIEDNQVAVGVPARCIYSDE